MLCGNKICSICIRQKIPLLKTVTYERKVELKQVADQFFVDELNDQVESEQHARAVHREHVRVLRFYLLLLVVLIDLLQTRSFAVSRRHYASFIKKVPQHYARYGADQQLHRKWHLHEIRNRVYQDYACRS
jgi:hypothetical protein